MQGAVSPWAGGGGSVWNLKRSKSSVPPVGPRPGLSALIKQCSSMSCLPHPPRGQRVQAGVGRGEGARTQTLN